MNTKKTFKVFKWTARVIAVIAVIYVYYLYTAITHEAEGNSIVHRMSGEIIYELKPTPVEQKLFKQKIQRTVEKFGVRIKRVASEYGRDWREVLSVVVWESAGNPCKVSSTGDVGLMQLQPTTAADVGLTKDLCHPYKNLRAGTQYLNWVRDEHGHSVFPMQLVAYNAGPTGAQNWFEEKNALAHPYARNVLKVYWVVRRMYP